MGFCLFNNVAIAARAYQAAFGGRVLVVDFDYHHGNGTQAVAGYGLVLRLDPRLPGLSRHRPAQLPARRGSRRQRSAAGRAGSRPRPSWQPGRRCCRRSPPTVQPDLLIVSAGFDYVAGDPVGDLGVGRRGCGSPRDGDRRRTAERFCGGRVAYVLEGGYDLDALTDSIAGSRGHARRAAGGSAEPADPRAVPPSVAFWTPESQSSSRRQSGYCELAF